MDFRSDGYDDYYFLPALRRVVDVVTLIYVLDTIELLIVRFDTTKGLSKALPRSLYSNPRISFNNSLTSRLCLGTDVQRLCLGPDYGGRASGYALTSRLCLGTDVQRLCLGPDYGGRASGYALPGSAW
jgi:hypothetical protein